MQRMGHRVGQGVSGPQDRGGGGEGEEEGEGRGRRRERERKNSLLSLS